LSEPHAIHCARCGAAYLSRPGAWLPACPSCGRSPSPLRQRLKNNRLAAVLAVLALFALGVGLTQPFMSMDKLGTRRTFSLPSGVMELFERGNVVIGSVLLVFSVLFPIGKLLAILLATSSLVPISLQARGLLHRFADVTGKYSMLDVLVVAVIIVMVKFKNLAHVEAHAGTIWFCGAVVLSMLAGACVHLKKETA
jgi:uncharacterized paraquat-inducible protein A